MWVYCCWVVMILCGWVVITDVWVWSIDVLLGVSVALSGEYGADGLWFEDEESSMSVSEFRYAVYSGSVWNERVELDDELFLFDESEYLCLSILKYFYFSTVYFSLCFNDTSFYYLFLIILYSGYYLLLFISNFLSAEFLRKWKYILYTEGKSIVYSWLWAEIVSVICESTGINIVIVVMSIRLVFWFGIIGYLFILLAGVGSGELAEFILLPEMGSIG